MKILYTLLFTILVAAGGYAITTGGSTPPAYAADGHDHEGHGKKHDEKDAHEEEAHGEEHGHDHDEKEAHDDHGEYQQARLNEQRSDRHPSCRAFQ